MTIDYLILNVSEGPLAQTGAPYARVPGIRVYGMLCLKKQFRRRGSKQLPGFSAAGELAGNSVDFQHPLPTFPAQWETVAKTLSET